MANLEVIPKVQSINVHTNNVISWNRIKKKPVLSPTEEILEYTKCLLHCWKRQQDEFKIQYANELDIECPIHKDIIKDEERDEIRVTAKIWLYSMDLVLVESAIINALERMSVRDIDTIIVAFPPNLLHEDSDVWFQQLLAVWSVFERYVDEDRVLRLGVSDMNYVQLEQFFHEVKVKPMINQVSLSNACSVPEELVQFAKDNSIQLLTHNDSPVILGDTELQSLLGSEFSSRDGLLWNMHWLIRYSYLYKNRGVIRSKGYLFHAEREIKRLPYC